MLKNEMKDELLACCKRLKLSRNMADNSELVEAEDREEYLLRLLKLMVAPIVKTKKPSTYSYCTILSLR